MRNKKIYILMVCLAVVLTGCGLNLGKKVNVPEVKKEVAANNDETSSEEIAVTSFASGTEYIPEKIPADFKGIEDIKSVKEYLKEHQVKEVKTDLEKTNDWFTHRNVEAGIEFKYPKNISIERDGANPEVYFEFSNKNNAFICSLRTQQYSDIFYVDDFNDDKFLSDYEDHRYDVVDVNGLKAMRFFTRHYVENIEPNETFQPMIGYQFVKKIGDSFRIFSFSFSGPKQVCTPQIKCDDYEELQAASELLIKTVKFVGDKDTADNVIDLGHGYTVNGDEVYFNGAETSLDKNSVKVLSDHAVDQDGCYYYGLQIEWCDPESFNILGSAYAKDKKGVYFGWETMEGVDARSFRYLGGDFAADRNYVYAKQLRIEHADLKTFTVIGQYYAKDKNNIYYLDNVLSNVDYDSFEVIDVNFSNDKKHVYWQNEISTGNYKAGGVPDSMKVLDEGCILFREEAYCFGEKVVGANNEKLKQIVYENAKTDYLTDGNNIYYKSVKMTGVDMASFVPNRDLWWTYSKDKNAVYFKGVYSTLFKPMGFQKVGITDYIKDDYSVGKINRDSFLNSANELDAVKILRGVDGKSFEQLTDSEYYTKDANKVYYDDEAIVGADPETFQVINYKFSRDKKDVYYHHSGIGADPETFEIVNNTYVKDKNKVYFSVKTTKPTNVGSISLSDRPDAATFSCNSVYLCMDKKRIYYFDDNMLKWYSDIDIATFKSLDEQYYADKNNIFYFSRGSNDYRDFWKIEGVDLESFSLTGAGQARDKNHKIVNGLIKD